ncbi:RepB family plasmid replication initiator protein [Photobacterium kishitanii]|uniref:Initiator Rep protein WH1 domain-containing protein n=1 Tax=Photobacterium kishitanii TaxID=318456 RepID=A0A2T3KMI2_9GAMM|nr:RepB family plasmid replication initiator protein [Photobacterium kishitanii]PSV01006.1 hypothetical protein C9J27_02980 [Photobacterium kishitanii]
MTSTHFKKEGDLCIRQCNALTSAAYNLTKMEKLVVYYAIHAINMKRVNFDKWGNSIVTISHANFANLYSLDMNNISRDLNKATTGIASKEIILFTPNADGDDGEKALDALSWTTKRAHKPKNGETIVTFAAETMELVNQLDNGCFTCLMLKEAGSLSKAHTMRLYESLRQWVSKGSITYTIEWMIDRYSLPEKYKDRMPDFRRRFLKAAIEDINEKTTLNVTYKENKKAGAKCVHSITFLIESVNGAELENKMRAIETYNLILDQKFLPSQIELQNMIDNYSHLVESGLDVGDEFTKKFDLCIASMPKDM